MKADFRINDKITNFVFIGEAGCGKSEIALNLAIQLAEEGKKPVHFFDLDMTKPLFRSRDAAESLQSFGINVHFEQQFMDAPTLTGGVRSVMRDDACYAVFDVGGDYQGARSLGGYAPLINTENTAVFYVINSYRPWSASLEHIDGVLSQVLGVSHIQLERLCFIGNPNIGASTRPEDVRSGIKTTEEIFRNTDVDIRFYCVRRELFEGIEKDFPAYPVKLYLTYFWEDPLPSNIDN